MTIKGRQLFVGNLPFVVGWQDLKDLFRKAGSVQRANIILSRDGRSKGHGIVLYATVADAQKAISEFDGYEWHGRRLEVREDRSAMDFPPPPPRTEGANQNDSENDKITSTNGLSVSVNTNDITSSSTQSTTSPVDYSITNNEILNVNGTNINGNTNGTTYSEEYTINNSNTGVSIANNNSSTLQRQLFVGNLPFRVRWQDLKDLFRKAGTVIRADVAMGYDNRSKGHGTVLFATLEEAKNAIAMFNQKSWQGRTLEVREDRGFVDPNIQNNVNGNGHHHHHHHHQHHSHHSQDHSRRVIDPTNHSHTQNPYGSGGPMIGLGGLFYGPRVQAPQQSYAGRLLFVGNLPFNCQWQDLKDLFRNAGNIIRADVSTNYDGRSKGFGTVLFATPEDARHAVVMYNGYEFQGRTLRVHFDKFSLLPLPPHHNPPPHPAHLPPPVHPHHRPPPLMSNIPHHNFHLGPPPPIPHHFMPPAHMGPFSPPLTTPSLTSPPPFPASYNPLAHLSNHPNANTNASSPFQPIPIVSSGSIANSQQTSTQSSQNISQDQQIATPTQFLGFGPIGKTHHSPQSTAISSSISNLGAVGVFSGSSNGIANNNGTNGITDSNNNNYGSGNDNNAIHSLTSTFASLHLSQAPQLFFHPAHHHPHHRPVIPTAYHPHHHHQVAAAAHAVAAAHHHQQQHHHQHPHHNHHPGAIGSGLVGINAHIHSQSNGTSDPVSATTTASNGLGSVVHPPSSSSNIVKETDNGIVGSSSATTEVTNNLTNSNNNSSNVPSPGLWDSSTSTMLSATTTVSNGSNGTSNSGSVISIGMTSSLAGMGSPTVGPPMVSTNLYL